MQIKYYKRLYQKPRDIIGLLLYIEAVILFSDFLCSIEIYVFFNCLNCCMCRVRSCGYCLWFLANYWRFFWTVRCLLFVEYYNIFVLIIIYVKILRNWKNKNNAHKHIYTQENGNQYVYCLSLLSSLSRSANCCRKPSFGRMSRRIRTVRTASVADIFLLIIR